MAEDTNKDLHEKENVDIKKENVVENKKEEPAAIVNVDNSKVTEKASQQVNRIFKDLETLAFHGSKGSLDEELIERVVSEVRDQSNIAKKQFSSNMSEKEFGEVTPHVNKVLKELKTLGDLSNKHAGEYDEVHAEKIFESLRKKINETKKGLKFKDKKDNKFTF